MKESPPRSTFGEATKRTLADRAARRCANPSCGASTSGPQTDPAKTLNVGVAAHISAASPGGPRYDPALTDEQRSAPENGLWLCQTCAKLVDNDAARYTSDVLRNWKAQAESTALQRIGRPDHHGGVQDKWVSAAYPERIGLTQELRRDGFDLVWTGADQENERIDLDGWECVLFKEHGQALRLKIRDPSVPGGYLVLLARRREGAD